MGIGKKIINKMPSLSTKRSKRNAIIITSVLTLALAGGAVLIMKSMEKNPESVPVVSQVVDQVQPQKPVITDVQSSAGDNTVDKAEELIIGYYAALESKDSTKLRALGCNDTANAVDLGWLDSIGWSLDASKIGTPSARSFPASQGLYAGCTLYKISDFFQDDPMNVIKSNIIGNAGLEGWVYYDAMNAKWNLVDPTIPTSISAAQSKNVQRQSNDKSVTVKMSSPGAYSNAWWSYTQVSVNISNQSSSTVNISKSKFDNGITASLGNGIPNSVNAGGTAQGVAVIYRGVTKNFGIEKIGATALEIDGDVSPVRIDYNGEDVSPVFAIGNSDAKELQNLLTQDQIDKYKASDKDVETTSALKSDKN